MFILLVRAIRSLPSVPGMWQLDSFQRRDWVFLGIEVALQPLVFLAEQFGALGEAFAACSGLVFYPERCLGLFSVGPLAL